MRLERLPFVSLELPLRRLHGGLDRRGRGKRPRGGDGWRMDGNEMAFLVVQKSWLIVVNSG